MLNTTVDVISILDMKVSKAIYNVCLYVFLCFFVVNFVACVDRKISSKHQLSYVDAIRDGNKIVNAVEQFKKITGRYPNRLNELVPQYLTRIPSTANYRYVPIFKTSCECPDPYWISFNERNIFSSINFVISYFTYSPSQEYKDTIDNKINYVFEGWASVTEKLIYLN